MARGKSRGRVEPKNAPVIGGTGSPGRGGLGEAEPSAALLEPRRVLGSKGLGRVLTERGREGGERTPTNG